MARKRDLVTEIAQIRERQGPGVYPVSLPYRMQRIAHAFKSEPTVDGEFLRYVPIGTVACIEGFFRSAIKECIDAGGRFIENAKHLASAKELRGDFDVLTALHGRRVSIGEVVAHEVPINALAQIESTMSTIIGSGFLEALKHVHSRWKVEVKGEPVASIIQDTERVFRDVAEMFRLRHIYAHELAWEAPDRKNIGEALESAVSFLEASAEVIGNLLHPNAPLTQADMNQHAAEVLETLDAEIEKAFGDVADVIDQGRRTLLREAQLSWREFRDREASFVASASLGGTIYPLIYGITAQALARVRLDDLRRSLAREKEVS